jgi:diguanylate cyclase
MTHPINLTEVDQGLLSNFEDRVFVIADEILGILKELSSENKQQINSKTLAERMFHKEAFKKILLSNAGSISDQDPENVKEIVNLILDRLAQIAPSSITQGFSELKNRDLFISSTDWIDSPVQALNKYITSLSTRNTELEECIKQTTECLNETEGLLLSEMSSQKEKFHSDTSFGKNILSSVGSIGNEINASGDLGTIKRTVMNKIESINKALEEKRQMDLSRLEETETTIESMSTRIKEIQTEAETIRQYAQAIEHESIRDSLTGLYNRKAYDNKVNEIIADVSRYDVPASLILCDIDYFKKINDNYGHKVGDLALKKLAQLLKDRLRLSDFISRYGGEEFVIILRHTNLDNAARAGEGLRSYIDKSIFSYRGEAIPLKVSIGISGFRKEDDSNSVFERADNALYLAKNSGRNMIKTERDVPSE